MTTVRNVMNRHSSARLYLRWALTACH